MLSKATTATARHGVNVLRPVMMRAAMGSAACVTDTRLTEDDEEGKDRNNPLDTLRRDCARRNLCDEAGFRRPSVHWTFSLAIGSDDLSEVRH